MSDVILNFHEVYEDDNDSPLVVLASDLPLNFQVQEFESYISDSLGFQIKDAILKDAGCEFIVNSIAEFDSLTESSLIYKKKKIQFKKIGCLSAGTSKVLLDGLKPDTTIETVNKLLTESQEVNVITIERLNERSAEVTLSKEHCDQLIQAHSIRIKGIPVTFSVVNSFNYIISSPGTELKIDTIKSFLADSYDVEVVSVKKSKDGRYAWLKVQAADPDAFNQGLHADGYRLILNKVHNTIFPASNQTILFTSTKKLTQETLLQILSQSGYTVNQSLIFHDGLSGAITPSTQEMRSKLLSVKQLTQDDTINNNNNNTPSKTPDKNNQKHSPSPLPSPQPPQVYTGYPSLDNNSTPVKSTNNNLSNSFVNSNHINNCQSPTKQDQIMDDIEVEDLNRSGYVTFKLTDHCNSIERLLDILSKVKVSNQRIIPLSRPILNKRIVYVELDSKIIKPLIHQFTESGQDSLVDSNNEEIKVNICEGEIPKWTVFILPLNPIADLSVLSGNPVFTHSRVVKEDGFYKLYMSSEKERNHLLKECAIYVDNPQPNMVWAFENPESRVIRSLNKEIPKFQYQFLLNIKKECTSFLIKKHIHFEMVDDSNKCLMIFSSPNSMDAEIQDFEQSLDSKYALVQDEISYSESVIPVKEYVKHLFTGKKSCYDLVKLEADSTDLLSIFIYGPHEEVNSIKHELSNSMSQSFVLNVHSNERATVQSCAGDLQQYQAKFIISGHKVIAHGKREPVVKLFAHIERLLNRQESKQINLTKPQEYFYRRIYGEQLPMCLKDTNASLQHSWDNKITLSFAGAQYKVREAAALVEDIKSKIQTVSNVTKRFSKESSSFIDEFVGDFFGFDSNICCQYQTQDYADKKLVSFIFFVYPALQYNVAKITDFIRMKEGETFEIQATQEQYSHVRTNLRQKVRNISYQNGYICVHGLWESSIDSLVVEINKLLESAQDCKTIRIFQNNKLQYDHLISDNIKRISFQKEFDVSIDVSKESIMIRGSSGNVNQACQHLKSKVDDIEFRNHAVSIHIVNDRSFKDFLATLKKQYDVSVTNHDSLYTVFGSKSLPWEEIDKKFSDLEPFTIEYPQHGNVNDLKLEDNFGLISIKFNPSSSGSGKYFLIGRNEKQVSDVIKKLQELVQDREVKSVEIDVPSNVLLYFARKSNIKHQFDQAFPNIQISFRDNSIGLLGPMHLLDRAKTELSSSIANLQKSLISNKVVHLLPPKVAREVLKLDFCKKFSQDHHVYIADETDQCEFSIQTKNDPNNNNNNHKNNKSNGNKNNNNNNNYGKKPELCSNLRLYDTFIEIEKNDILSCKTETIVNAANDALYHAGGIAGAISRAAGPMFQKESTDYVNKNGPLQVGSAVETSSYGLERHGIKSVIHTVAPVYNNHHPEDVTKLLKTAIHSSLAIANKRKYRSISIPVIGSGVYGIPKAIATEAIVMAVIEFINNSNSKYFSSIRGTTSLKIIKLIDNNDDCILNLQRSLTNQSQSIDNRKYDSPHLSSQEPSNEVNQEATSLPTLEQSFQNNLKVYQPEIFKLAYQWKWRENDGSYKNFDPDQNYQIETAYLNKLKKFVVTGDLNGVKNNAQYEIDFDKMTELNLNFKTNPRPIKREKMEFEFVGSYYYVRGGETIEIHDIGGHIKMAATRGMSVKLDNYFIKFPESTVEEFSGGSSIGKYPLKQTTYEQSFDMYNAKNTTNSNDKPKSNPNPSPSTSTTSTPQSTKTEDMVNVVLWSPTADQTSTKSTLITSIKRTMYHTHRVELMASGFIEKNLDKIMKAVQSNYCELKDNGPKHIDIYGPILYTPNVENQVLLLQYSVGGIEKEYPWDINGKVERLKEILSTSDEGRMVNDYFFKTMPAATSKIVKIEKVQNNESWSRYYDSALPLTKRLDPTQTIHGTTLNKYELYLFHGTNNFKPSDIYNDAVAFDMRFSATNCMWGRAAYFAVNASYSAISYGHSLPNGQFQVFLARVMIGDTTSQPSNTKIQRPPAKPKTGNDDTIICYDSINGVTNGSQVYMIYEVNRAYPSYLITYTK